MSNTAVGYRIADEGYLEPESLSLVLVQNRPEGEGPKRLDEEMARAELALGVRKMCVVLTPTRARSLGEELVRAADAAERAR